MSDDMEVEVVAREEANNNNNNNTPVVVQHLLPSASPLPNPSSSATPMNEGEEEDVLTSTIKELNSPKAGKEEEELIKKVVKEEVIAIDETKKQQQARLKALRDAQNASLDSSRAANAEARLKFLQEQVEVFSRFTGDVPVESVAGAVSAGPGRPKKGTVGGGRTKKTEEEEDRELIEAGKKGLRATRLTVQPGCIKGGDMRPYQIEGLNWMINLYEQGINGILADEMGLGKTLQSISLLGYLKFERGVSGPHIVVVPKAVLTNWQREFKRWCPDMRVIHIHGDKDERTAQIKASLIAGTFDVCITTYEILMIEKSAFLKFQWRYIIVDEAHRLKSEQTKTAQIVRELSTQFRLLVTGTPLQNNLHELWALLNFLLPEVFGDAALFEEYFKIEDMAQDSVISKLHSILKPFMIRRLKVDVEKNLPPKREIKLYTGLSEMQEYWYKTILNKDMAVLNQLGGPDRSRLLNILMQLRKVCNHPYLFQGAEPGPPYFDGPHIYENAGKLFLVDKLLAKLKANGDRVLIFSQMTRVLDILEDYMRYKEYEYCRIDGSTSGDQRDAEMDAYNAPGSSKFVFLLSTRAGGLGINLATANIVILYDSDWNPQMDLQAQDRAHRIGQKKPVTVFRLVTEGTIEEKIVERAEKKLYLDAVVVQQGRLQQQNAALSKSELMTMVKFGAEAIFRSGGKRVTDEDIDAILERDTKRTDELKEKFKTDVQHNLMNFRLDAPSKGEEKAIQIDESKLLMEENSSTGLNFINLPSRVRAGRAQAEVEAAGGEEKEEKRPRGMQMFDYQFFNVAAIRKIEEAEAEVSQRRKTQNLLIKESKAREKHDETGSAAQESERLMLELETIQVSDELKQEKQRLIAEGFPNWMRRDFRTYTSCLERFGRNSIEEIVQTVSEQTSKSREEILRYHNVFWKRFEELDQSDKLIERIERGEQRIKRKEIITKLLDRKVKKYKNPAQSLVIDYGVNKGKAFTEEEDRFLVCAMHRIGFGNWDQIRQEIRKSWVFRFDWFFKSRTSLEILKRCEILIKLLEKEEEDERNAKRGKKEEEVMVGGGDKKRAKV